MYDKENHARHDAYAFNTTRNRRTCLTDTVSIVNNLCTSASATCQVNGRVEVRVARIARLELQGSSEKVPMGGNIIGGDRVLQSLHDVAFASPPAFDLADNNSGVLIVSLHHVAGINASGHVLDSGLQILTTRKNNTFSEAAGPLATDAGNPTLATKGTETRTQLGLDPNTNAEIELEGGGGKRQGAGDIVVVKLVPKIVDRKLFLQDGLVARAGEQMLALSRSVLGSDLAAEEAPGRHALIIVLGLELFKGLVHLAKGYLVEAGVLNLLPLRGRGAIGTQRSATRRSHGRTINTGVWHEAQVRVFGGGLFARHGRVGRGASNGRSSGSGSGSGSIVGRSSSPCCGCCGLEVGGDIGVGFEVLGTREEMLLLARRVLRSGLLAVDALHRHALVAFWKGRTAWSVHAGPPGGVGCGCLTGQYGDDMTKWKYDNIRYLRSARNSTKALWTSWSTWRGMIPSKGRLQPGGLTINSRPKRKGRRVCRK